MGETRAKKVSNRAAKKKGVDEKVVSSRGGLIGSNEVHSITDGDMQSTDAASSPYLAVPSLASKASRSSILSSSSSSTMSRRFDLDIFEPSRIEVRLTPNKGYALFAASHIPAGKVVLAEIPAIRLTKDDEARIHEADDILLEKFNQLPKPSQRLYKKLHDARKDGFSKMRSIYHSNCYNLDGSRSEHGGSCLGLTASRINHSCIPNVQFTFSETVPDGLFELEDGSDNDLHGADDRDPQKGAMMFRALKPIARGKEILSNYESVYAIRSQRQAQLQLHYGFRCDCEACVATTSFWAEDDNRRLEMIRKRRILDSMEKRIIVKEEMLTSGLEEQIYYLKSKTGRENVEIPGDDHTPLTEDCCREMQEVLAGLSKLLIKEGLVGKELQWVDQEDEVWKERARSCTAKMDIGSQMGQIRLPRAKTCSMIRLNAKLEA